MPPLPRIDVIRKIIETTPNDPFPRYGYAMELKTLGRHEEAVAAFTEMEQRFPDYVAQYLMHHNVLVALRRKDEARAVCERGVVAARLKGDGHAAGELQQAIEALADAED